jgi:hypothetical protein
MEQGIRPITFNIYADSDEEAEKGRKAIIQFINIMGQHGGKVSGNKIAEAVGKLGANSFIASQIIKFFKQ